MKNRPIKSKLLFWTYLFQIAIVSLLLFIWSALVALDVIPNKMGTAFNRYPWLEIVLPFCSGLLTLVSGAAIIQYRKGKHNWAYWTIAAGIYCFFYIVGFRNNGSIFADNAIFYPYGMY